MALASLLVACGDDESDVGSFESTVADCGSNLDELFVRGDGIEPSYDASYSEALEAWSFPAAGCGFGVLRGRCADGKQVLYRNGGFVSEIRYFDGEQLVGYVGSGDVGVCPSVCPFSHYYGAIDSVRCEAPSFEDLCEGSSIVLGLGEPWMPFANGRAPGGCESF